MKEAIGPQIGCRQGLSCAFKTNMVSFLLKMSNICNEILKKFGLYHSSQCEFTQFVYNMTQVMNVCLSCYLFFYHLIAKPGNKTGAPSLPAHTCPWHWNQKSDPEEYRSLSSLTNDFNHKYYLGFEKPYQMQKHFMVHKIYSISQLCSILHSLRMLHTWLINTLRLRRNGCHFADNIFKHIFLN